MSLGGGVSDSEKYWSSEYAETSSSPGGEGPLRRAEKRWAPAIAGAFCFPRERPTARLAGTRGPSATFNILRSNGLLSALFVYIIVLLI